MTLRYAYRGDAALSQRESRSCKNAIVVGEPTPSRGVVDRPPAGAELTVWFGQQ